MKILKNRTSYLGPSPLTAKEGPLQQLPGNLAGDTKVNNLIRNSIMVTTVCSAINTKPSVYQGILKKRWHNGWVNMSQCSDNILFICTMARERGTRPSQGQLFNWYAFAQWGQKCNIILDAHLYMWKLSSCFWPLLFLVSKSLYNCTKCVGMHFRAFIWVLKSWKSAGLGNWKQEWPLELSLQIG